MKIDWNGQVVVDGEVIKLVRVRLDELFDRTPNLAMVLHRARAVGLIQCPAGVAAELGKMFAGGDAWEYPTRVAMLPHRVDDNGWPFAYDVSFGSGEVDEYVCTESIGFAPSDKFVFAVPDKNGKWYLEEASKELPPLQGNPVQMGIG